MLTLAQGKARFSLATAMNDNPINPIPNQVLYSRLSICAVALDGELTLSLEHFLGDDRYQIAFLEHSQALAEYIEAHKEQIDCLVLNYEESLGKVLLSLSEQGVLLPVILLMASAELSGSRPYYHSAEVYLPKEQLGQIGLAIDQALAQFLHLAPSCPLSARPKNRKETEKDNQAFLMLQQRRLAEKLKERLGYLGVYYKRNAQYFYRNLSEEERQELMEQLRLDYSEIIFNYFSEGYPINDVIDQFVNRAFFADLSISQILELHMGLMDEFSQQLKLEGRNEDILLDYRLTLIDIIAHLCEMYRRSIPREDLPFELLFRID